MKVTEKRYDILENIDINYDGMYIQKSMKKQLRSVMEMEQNQACF